MPSDSPSGALSAPVRFPKALFVEVPAMAFSFKKSAELFPAAIRKKKRAGFAYRRFETAADAVRFAIEELPADSLNGAYLQVDEARFDQNGIRSLYESHDFPLPRRKPKPAPAAAGTSQDAA
jgi:hypothetical protein